jgi:hypothetical protein
MLPSVETHARSYVVVTVWIVAPEGTVTVRGFTPDDSVQFAGTSISTVWSRCTPR